MSVGQVFLEAVALHQAGQLDQAAIRYQAVLAEHPGHTDALHYSGLIAFQQGNYRQAVDLIGRAIELAQEASRVAPAEYLVNFGNALKRHGNHREAMLAYEKAAALRPDLSAVWFNLALLQRDSGAIPAAIAALEAACRGSPPMPRAWVELGECHAACGDDRKALYCFEQVLPSLRVRPLPDTLVELAERVGRSLVEMGRYDPAVKLLEPLCADSSKHAGCLNALGCALSGLGRLSEAERYLSRAQALVPDDSRVSDNLACVLKDSARNEEALLLFERLIAAPSADAGVWSNYLFTLLYSDRVSPLHVLREHQRFAARFSPVKPPDVACGAGAPEAGPLRLGYLSGDFRNHPVAYFLIGLLESHDRGRVFVHLYDNGAVSDGWTARLKQSAAAWRPVRGLTDQQLATQIREDRIDVLIDLSGHTADNRLPALATHPAPVQASYLGYPFSTGLAWLDWRLVDAITDPPGTEALSVERLYRLPRSYYVYSAPEGAPAVSDLPALKNGYLTFGVCSNLAKVSPTALDFWAALLRSQPDSRLYWRAKAFADPLAKRRMLDALSERGVVRKRLRLEPWLAHEDRWQGFRQFDLALDTYPYNQATNTCEALWMGVPTLSLAGCGHPSRMGASILNDAGLAEWVFEVQDFQNAPETFLEQVSRLFDVEALAELRKGLRDRLQNSRLMDGPGAARAVEDACAAMLAAARHG